MSPNRAISFYKKGSDGNEKDKTFQITDAILADQQWKDLTSRAFERGKKAREACGDQNPFTALKVYKDAMEEAAAYCKESNTPKKAMDTTESNTPKKAMDTTSEIGVVMRTIKAMEADNEEGPRKAARQLEDIQEMCDITQNRKKP